MISRIKLVIKRIKYRRKNKHNFTKLIPNTNISNIIVGKGTYGDIDVLTYRGENSKLYIGNYCSIAHGCVFILGGEHTYNRLSTYPFKAKYLCQEEAKNKGDIIIEDDVWVGMGTTILSGVRIGQGAIIGAKSVVAKNIPPYAIYAGNRIIKYRFSEYVIEQLMKIDFSKMDIKFIKENIENLYLEITDENVDQIVKNINEWNVKNGI